jgi:hypothetical protein
MQPPAPSFPGLTHPRRPCPPAAPGQHDFLRLLRRHLLPCLRAMGHSRSSGAPRAFLWLGRLARPLPLSRSQTSNRLPHFFDRN